MDRNRTAALCMALGAGSLVSAAVLAFGVAAGLATLGAALVLVAVLLGWT